MPTQPQTVPTRAPKAASLALAAALFAVLITSPTAQSNSGSCGYIWVGGGGNFYSWTIAEMYWQCDFIEYYEYMSVHATATAISPWGSTDSRSDYQPAYVGSVYVDAFVQLQEGEYGYATAAGTGGVCIWLPFPYCEPYSDSVSYPILPPPPPPPPPPTLKLFLDSYGNFDTNNPSSGDADFLPGSDIALNSVELPQVVHLIAAYVDDQNHIVPPPSGGVVSFNLTNVSAFKGMAMNASHPQRGDDLPDVVLGGADSNNTSSSASSNFYPDNTARVDAVVWDYGGFATVTAQHAGSAPSFRMPRDDGANGSVAGNWLPDGGWKDQDQNLVPDTFASCSSGATCDIDFIPDVTVNPTITTGLTGDGFTNFEEFRGFVVRGEHKRTNPKRKDLFISSNVSFAMTDMGILYAFPALPTSTHRVWGVLQQTGPEYTETRVMNANDTNSGYGGDIVGHFDQKALKVIALQAGAPSALGCTVNLTSPCPPIPGTPGVTPLDPNFTDHLEVYVGAIASLAADDEIGKRVVRKVIGHEVGHGIHICHPEDGCVSPTDPSVSIMDSPGVFAPFLGDPGASYDSSDQQQIRLHPRQY